MGKLFVYKASAGSGKTFTLAASYIRCLIRNPQAYREILAVTFTNKATAEMKERILSQLYGISRSDPDSDIYLNRVQEGMLYSTNEIRQRAGIALTNLIHDYSHFRVETIDSFFQSVMRNLARELGLSANLNVELDNGEVLSEAVDSMIEKLTPDSHVLTWLLDYIHERIADDKRWDVSEEIKRFGRNIFDEGYIEKGGNLRQRLRDPNVIKAYRKELEDKVRVAFEEMAEFADIFEEELDIVGLAPDKLRNGLRGIGSYFRKIRAGKLFNKVRTATVEKCLNDPYIWGAKSSPYYHRIINVATNVLMILLRETEEARVVNNFIVNSCRLSIQHLNKLQLLTHIDDEVRRLNRENNRFLLSDTNALLHRLIGDGDSSFIFEKTGAGIKNVMIDEFQDTSRMQWDNFKLLLLEGLSQGANSLIVGDVKQSIYRWRNGDWAILNNLNGSLGSFPIEVRMLNTNRRSESTVVRFNNVFFTQAVNYLNTLHVDELGEPCEPLTKAYQDVMQQSSRVDIKGYVSVSFLEPDDENDYLTQTLIYLANEVRRLLITGVRPSDIAILVRKNKNIPPIANYFDKELHCRLVSDEAFRLDASPAVCIMIDALRCIADDTDRIAQAQLAMNYQNGVLKRNADPDILLQNTAAALPEAFTGHMDALRLMPLYELLEELFRIFQLERMENQDAYLFAFFDAVLEHLKDHPSDPGGFVAEWEKTLCRKTIPAGAVEGIRIFSIHKSKGLEFHTVLIPFCDWKLENETHDQLVWCKPSEEPYNGLDMVPVSYSALMAESIYKKDYLNERLQLWVDNLNLLYVAFTRAGKNLIVWSRKGQKGTTAELLSNALTRVAQEAGIVWDDSESFEQGELCISEAKNEKIITNKLLQKPKKLLVRMEPAHHGISFRQSNRSADFIRETTGGQPHHMIDRGRLLHTLFAAIRTKEDVEPAIERLVFEGIIADRETEDDLRTVAAKALAHPQAEDWYSGGWRLYNECAIIYNEEGKTEVRRPDRVMMKDGRTVVVDFKFGKPDKRYETQVQHYMGLLARMGHANPEGYIWYAEEGNLLRTGSLAI
ncbi:MAG: UvrD-helicase domain-containing protein [Mediterranea sp.]|jgi:ATP-dependent exoDNAse (exonuclease V) beta subunit|nr:UvrD-helicase domain-containing protein [Mediterranea sp.]